MPRLLARTALLPACMLLACSPAAAQLAPAPTPTPAQLARYDLDRNGRLDPGEVAAMRADEARASGAAANTSAGGQPLVELSPFEVNASQDRGYQASTTMSGTRLNSRLEDLASSITVVTKQQLLDTAAVDLNDIFLYEGNTEGTFQYTEWQQDRGYTIDVVAQNPQVANRVRGLSSANMARNNFATSTAIPVDTYNVDAVEISRGPNSSIFGLGDASGTVNLIALRANARTEKTQLIGRIDSSGGWRASLDVNRPIFRDKLGVRVAALYEEREFERKPSLDKTNRLTAAVMYKPFRKTTLNASYESYHNFNNRANSTTPRDTITEWRAAGSPVWDPVTSSWRLLGGTAYTQVLPANDAAQLPHGINPNFSNFWNRPSWFINPDGSIGLYAVNRASNPPTGTQVAGPGLANSNIRYMQNGTIIQRGGGVFGVPPTPLFQQPGVTDRSIYDWESINNAAPNFGKQKADIYQVELEQWLVDTNRHKLAIQAGFLREDIAKMSRNFIGASDGAPPVIQVDINERLLDGRPNPYFLQPYIGGSEPQIFRYPELNDNYRATLAYQVDLTGGRGWRKWLGMHRFAGYGEYRENVNAPNGLRHRDKIVSDHAWMSAANLTNIPGRGAETNIYARYYLGGPVNQPGPVVDFAPARPLAPQGPQTLTWFNSSTNQWVNEPVTIGEVYFALGQQKREVRTKGIIWQGFLADDRIVPTLGLRNDRVRSVGNVTVPLDPATRMLDTSYLDQFGTNWVERSGDTTTKGVVVKPFRNWREIDQRIERSTGLARVLGDGVRSMTLLYNESDSFQPAAAAYSIFAEALPNPTGKGKDYGVTFSLFEGKFSAKINRYETFQKDARNGSTAVLATRPLRLDYDTTGANATFGTIGGDTFDLEDNVSQWVIALNPSWTVGQQEAEVYRIMGLSKERVDAIKNIPGSISDINNVVSRGLEMDFNYNPTRDWTLKASIVKQEAIDQDLSPAILKYINERMPLWTSIRVPTTPLPDGTLLPNAGGLWWTTGAPGATGVNIPANWFTTNVDAPYKLAVTNAGKPRPQTRKWRFNATTNYRLAGLTENRWLRAMSVGGSVRWEDRAIVGFRGAAPDPDGAIRSLDGNRPIYDKRRYYADLLWTYDFRLRNDTIRGRVQLNVRNVLENGRLQAVSYNPDGTPWNFRIIDPRQFILTATFDL